MAITKITEELDFLQKKVSSLKEIYKLYPDTVKKINKSFPDDAFYCSNSINKDVDTVRFGWNGSWLCAYSFKLFGNVEVHSTPERFILFSYDNLDLFKQLIIQNYQDTMIEHSISASLIRKCDAMVISFIKERKIDLSKTNLKDINPDTTIGKLLSLL